MLANRLDKPQTKLAEREAPAKFNAFESLGTQLRLLTIAAVGLGSFGTENLMAKQDDSYRPSHLPEVESVQTQDSAIYVKDVSEVANDWSRDNRFFLKGEVPISSQQQEEIKALLKNHPDWTVFVERDSKSSENQWESYEERAHHDVTLSYLTTMLGNTSRFKEITDSKTSTASGAILVISFNQDMAHGKVSLFTQESRDHLDVGDKNWKGNLDHFAIAHLKNENRNITKAISSTLENLDNLYQDRRDSPLYVSQEYRPYVIGGAIAAALVGGFIWLARKSGGSSGWGSGSSGNSFFFFSDSGGGGGGDFGGGGDGGGFGSSDF